MSRKALFASLIALAAATSPALASGSGDNGTLGHAGAPSGSTAGGGTIAMSGGGDDRSFTYAAPHAQPGRTATLAGGGDNAEIVYRPAASATSSIAQMATGGLRG